MNKLFNVQEAIFQQIKQQLPSNLSFVHEISELLGLSYDSAYRRIRGEKIISLEELYKLSTHFGISVDSLFDIKSGKIVFDSLAIDPENMNLKRWLQSMLKNMQMVENVANKKIIYAAKDAPFFHYFHIPELAAFKLFFWQKTLFQFPGYQEKKFSLDDYDAELQQIGQRILLSYTRIPTAEIWNEDTFYIMLRQMEYYWVSGLFEKEDEMYILIGKVENWINHLRRQAEYGFQYICGTEPNGIEGSFSLFENEVVLNDNTVLVTTGERKTTFLTYNVVNLLTTSDPLFCGKIERFLNGLIKKSIQISTSAAKERNRFFNKLEKQVQAFRYRIEKY
jgi:hypothetical protein